MAKSTATISLHLTPDELKNLLTEALQHNFSPGAKITVDFEVGEDSDHIDRYPGPTVLKGVTIKGATEKTITLKK